MLKFDNQVSAPLSSKTKELMSTYLAERECPPHVFREAYLSIYELAGAKPEDHFIFTSSGAEAVNHVIFSAYLDVTRKTGKNHFLAASIDEAPTLMAMSRLNEMGCVFQTISANVQGQITAKAVAESISPRTALLSLSWANGLIGVIQPVQEIAALCKDRGILFHVDATHVLGKGGYTFEESGADFLSFNGEQIHGPSGTGGLFIRKNLAISPFIMGGPQQAHTRGGNSNLGLLFGLAQAAREAKEQSDHLAMETARLKLHFEKTILENIVGAKSLFAKTPRVPHITAFTFQGVHSEALAFLLNQKGLSATCGGGELQHFSHILKACKIKEKFGHTALSFGLNHTHSEEEITKASTLIVECVLNLQRHTSTFMQEALWE